MARRTTIVDIAREAGVSPKTVSRVLNNEPYVREDVREKVNEVAQRLDYHPNVNAQGLISQRNYLIGLTYEKPSPSYVVDLQRGAIERLKGERYRLIVLPFDKATSNAQGLVALLRSAMLDGVVLAPPSSDILAVLDRLDKAHIPYARIAPHLAPERGVVSNMDDVAAARAVAQHLVELGHRKFGIITGDPTHHAVEARLEGYRLALEAAGINFESQPRAQGNFGFDEGETAAHKLLTAADRPTAILAQNDDMAAAALGVARQMGLSVPDDLSVVGFDNSEIARLCSPPLTTVRQPVVEMAYSAVDGLLRQLEGDEPARPPVHPHELLLRGSTARPPSQS